MTEEKEEKERGLGYLFFSSLSVVGWIQLVLQVVFPISLQMEMLNLPKLARTRLITLPSSHSMSTVVPSHPYFVRRSDPADIYVNQNIFNIIYQAFAWPLIFGLFRCWISNNTLSENAICKYARNRQSKHSHLDKQFLKRIHGWVLHFPCRFFLPAFNVCFLFDHLWTFDSALIRYYPLSSDRQNNHPPPDIRNARLSLCGLLVACAFGEVSGSLKI